MSNKMDGTMRGERELVRYDGDVNTQKDWRFIASEAGKMVYVPFEGYYESKGGRIQSPILKLDKSSGESAFYSIKFKARSAVGCYWWVDLFDANGKPQPDINSAVYPGENKADYNQMIYVNGDAASIQLAFVSNGGISVSDIVVRRVSAESAAAWADTLYATLPQLKFIPPADSFRRLPKTAAALENGKPFRVVMLGDSIMNDSYNSLFQSLVQRDFPNSALEFMISVRGSTGCWFYFEPENFKEYVTDQKPDLLMIGGISNLIKDKEDIPNGMKKITRVIEQAKELGCEIVLLSPPHSVDWRPDSAPGQKWTEATRFHSDSLSLMYSEYEKTAAANGVAFWNMTVPNTSYIADSGKPLGWFNRDFIHNNDRGKQIIGRILQAFFKTAKLS